MSELEDDQKEKTDPPQWTHLLVESSSLEELRGPLRGSARLKFTCMSVSVRYIALGSNTGNVYVFDRSSLKHLQVVFPEVEPSPVNVVALCPNDKLVAFSTINGHVVVMEMNIEKRQKPDRLRNITEHLRTTVTCLHWETSGNKLYCADSTGKVSVASVPRMKNLVLPVDVIMRLESPVVQLDWADDKLLVSTMTRCYLCSTTRQQYSQVGKKPREGEYGGCFYKLNKSALPLLYCARPSSRIWEVDFEGTVLSTHQFKQLLAVPPFCTLNLKEEEFQKPAADSGPQGTNYSQMKMIGSQFLVAVNGKKMFIFNPVKVKVILWTEFSQAIQDINVISRDIFLFFVDGEVRKIQLFPVAQVISILIKRKNLLLASDIFCKFEQVLIQAKWRKHLSVSLLQEFYEKLKDQNKISIAENVKQVLSNMQSGKEADSDEDSATSFRSRSSSTTSIRSYSSGFQQPIGLEAEKIPVQDTNLADSDSSNTNLMYQEQTEEVNYGIDQVNGGKLPSPLIDTTNDQCVPKEKSNSNEITSSENSKKEDYTMDITTPEMINDKENSVNNEVKQGDEDLAPVIAVENTIIQRQSSVKGKKKRIVNLVDSSSKQRKNSSKGKGKLPIYEDDIFASDDIPSSKGKIKKEKRKSKGIATEAKPSDNKEGSCHTNTQESTSTQELDSNVVFKEHASHDLKSSEENEKPMITNQEGKILLEKSSSLGDLMINNDQVMKDQSVANGNHNGACDVTVEESALEEPAEDGHSNKLLKSSNSTTDIQSGFNRSVIHRAMSESDILHAVTPNIDPEMFDSGGSSPSYSPLSQSWEGTIEEGMEQSPKLTLTSVKDSLQSKFSLTKKRLLKTIKEKNILSRSPLLESSSPVSQSSSASSKLISTVLEDDETKRDSEEVEVVPPLDLTDLELTTESTHLALQDLSVLLNPDLVQEILRKWVIQLNKYLQALHTKVHNDKLDELSGHVKDKKQSKEEVKFYQGELDTISQCSDADSEDICSEDTPDILTNGKPPEEVKSLGDITFSETIHSVDPFLMSPELHQSVSELAQTCYMTEIYGDIAQYIKPAQNNNQENMSANHSNITNSLPLNSEQTSGESSGSNIQNSQRTQESSNGQKECDLELDQGQGHRLLTTAKCVFMKCHCHLLNMSEVKQEVYSCQGDVFEQWYSYVLCLQDMSKNDMFCKKLSNNEVHYAEDILKIGDFAADRTLGYVSQLFEINPTKAIDFSVDSRHIKPLDVYLMCLCYNRPVSQHFFRYMSAKVSDALTVNRFQSPEVYGHPVVIVKWLELLLSLSSHKEPLADSDDCPVPQSHKVPWKYQEMIEHVLKTANDALWLQLLETCTLSKYWFGCLKLMKLLQRQDDMLTLILQLGDITLFDSGSSVGYLPDNKEEWKFLLKKLMSMQRVKPSGTTCNTTDVVDVGINDNQQRITATEVCRLMVYNLGAATTISLLEECAIPEIPSEALPCAVTATYLQTHQRNIAHNMLEKLDSYLWAKKPVALMPELQYFVSHEKLVKANHSRVPEHDTNFSHLPSSSLPCFKYREEMDLHWGVASKINRACACCNIVLTETVSHVEPGVLVFDCGHVFHKMCNPERQCLTCMSQVPDGLQFV